MGSVAILGSARSDGNTAKVLSRLLVGSDSAVFDLNKYQVSPFDYSQCYPEDEFLKIVQVMVEARLTLFATPVYWYSYSAVMKGFLDRMSDLLMSRQNLGRQLRGRAFALLTTSAEPRPDPDLGSSFRRFCEYLGVQYVGCVHAEADGPFVDPEIVQRIQRMLSEE